MGNKYVGIDLGGTKIAGAVYDTSTQMLSGELVVPTRAHEGPDGVLKQLAEVVQQVCNRAGVMLTDLGGIGVGMPATFDLEKGQTLLLPNIPGEWWGKPVVEILKRYLGFDVALVNDARAFTLAEANLGAGRGFPSVVGITLGTGLGGGFAINGKLHLGLYGATAEVGHHSIDLYGVPDGSGNAGAWEGYASGPAIASMGVKAVMQGVNTKLGELVGYDLNKITPRTIVDAAEMGDAVALGILKRAGEYLGAGVSNVIILLAPHCVVIGGGMADLGGWVMNPIQEVVQRRCHTLPTEKLTIKFAELGVRAGYIGAAMYAAQDNR